MNRTATQPSLLDVTLAAATRDRQIATPTGGVMELVLCDPRPDSPTCGEVCRVVMSEHHRVLVNRAAQRAACRSQHRFARRRRGRQLSGGPVRCANPDKYRLPIGTDLIPYSFGSATGW
jgi:dTDP-4-dehydrorhamnose 3,5-epimerase